MLINIYNADEGSDRYRLREAALLSALGIKDKFHDAPFPLPNQEEVTEAELWRWRSTYTIRTEAWAGQKQLDGKFGTLLLYFVDAYQLIGGGFAVFVPHDTYNGAPVRYFKWTACDHVFRGKTVANCLHRYTCEKCGASYEIDSSD